MDFNNINQEEIIKKVTEEVLEEIRESDDKFDSKQIEDRINEKIELLFRQIRDEQIEKEKIEIENEDNFLKQEFTNISTNPNRDESIKIQQKQNDGNNSNNGNNDNNIRNTNKVSVADFQTQKNNNKTVQEKIEEREYIGQREHIEKRENKEQEKYTEQKKYTEQRKNTKEVEYIEEETKQEIQQETQQKTQFLKEFSDLYKQELNNSIESFKRTFESFSLMSNSSFFEKVLILLFLSIPAVLAGLIGFLIVLIVFLLWQVHIFLKVFTKSFDRIETSIKETINKIKVKISTMKGSGVGFLNRIIFSNLLYSIIMFNGLLYVFVKGIAFPIRSLAEIDKIIANITVRSANLLSTTLRSPSELALNNLRNSNAIGKDKTKTSTGLSRSRQMLSSNEMSQTREKNHSNTTLKANKANRVKGVSKQEIDSSKLKPLSNQEIIKRAISDQIQKKLLELKSAQSEKNVIQQVFVKQALAQQNVLKEEKKSDRNNSSKFSIGKNNNEKQISENIIMKILGELGAVAVKNVCDIATENIKATKVDSFNIRSSRESNLLKENVLSKIEGSNNNFINNNASINKNATPKIENNLGIQFLTKTSGTLDKLKSERNASFERGLAVLDKLAAERDAKIASNFERALAILDRLAIERDTERAASVERAISILKKLSYDEYKNSLDNKVEEHKTSETNALNLIDRNKFDEENNIFEHDKVLKLKERHSKNYDKEQNFDSENQDKGNYICMLR